MKQEKQISLTESKIDFGNQILANILIREIMKNWNGKEIASAQSKGGVKVVAHPFDNLISTGCDPWPPAEIIQKLYKSNHQGHFPDEEQKICTSGLGYYCDLQSLHSEDAITWSIFGTVACTNLETKRKWVADFFRLLGLTEYVSSTRIQIFLWRRIPHPDTLVSGGPEIDFGIISGDSVILGEAKWKSGIGKAQGKKKDKDQIQLRGEFLCKYGKHVFSGAKNFAVVGLGLWDEGFQQSTHDGVIFKTALWKDVCNLQSHPHAEELRRYYDWKVRHSKFSNNELKLMNHQEPDPSFNI